jgi:thermolysin
VSAAPSAKAAAPAAAFAAPHRAESSLASAWGPTPAPSQDRSRRGREQAFAATGAHDLREWDAHLVSLERDGRLRTRRSDVDTVVPGHRHERLDQYHEGVRVFGADVARETAGGITVQVVGRLFDGIEVETEPRLTADEAAAAAERMTGGGRFARPPELVVLPRTDGTFALAWRVATATAGDLPEVFVNAITGAEELRLTNMHRQAAFGRGKGVKGDEKKMSVLASGGQFLASDRMRPPDIVTYDMRGDLSLTKLLINGWISPSASNVAADSDNQWNDPAVVDAHSYMGWTYDYLFKRFGRRGLDQKDRVMRAVTHPVKREEAGWQTRADWNAYVLNAFWCNTCGSDRNGMMVFGDGLRPNYYFTEDGCNYDYFSGALDIVAHELAHGVTSHSSNLVYAYEPGALNEAFSDIIGTSAEFYFQPAGSGSLKADYLIGEDVITPLKSWATPPIRSLADPRAYGDPDHYSRRYLGQSDNGGVHTNSTIPSHACYLAIDGGTNRTSGMSVQGVGSQNRDQIEKAFYRAWVYMLPSYASFSLARAATIQSARELYRAGSAAERAITQAWTAVGVY